MRYVLPEACDSTDRRIVEGFVEWLLVRMATGQGQTTPYVRELGAKRSGVPELTFYRRWQKLAHLGVIYQGESVQCGARSTRTWGFSQMLAMENGKPEAPVETVSRTKRCEHCGTEFEFTRSTAKYCKPSCRLAAHKARKRDPVEGELRVLEMLYPALIANERNRELVVSALREDPDRFRKLLGEHGFTRALAHLGASAS